ncbi:Caspase domain-containing protein [Streptomyces sp. cf386]|nr:Caspase domain-containing protein [Streptomyces sp. cf386]
MSVRDQTAPPRGAGGDPRSTYAAGEPTVVRRLVVVGGTSCYDLQDHLPGVSGDLDTVSEVFQQLGYTEDHRLHDSGTESFRRGLSDWAAAEARTDDALVLYYTGHGDRDHSRHYVLCRDSDPSRLGGTALATEDLVRIVTESGVERLLLIVDTCYAGQGGVDAARTVAEELGAALTVTRAADEGRLTAFSVIAAARSGEAAEDGAFARALRAAVDDLTLGGHRQRKLYLEEVVDRVNDVLAADGPFQHAAWGTLPSGEGFPFFPNPRYAPDTPAGIDLDEQRTWNSREGRRRRSELLSHFDPRGRGADALGGKGSYFVGRVKACSELAAWLTVTDADGRRSVVVTGSGGVGKSALLGRLVLDARADGAPLTAIHARHKSLEEITSGMADAAGFAPGHPATQHPDRLVEALSARRTPLHIVVDALDEAGTASITDAEPERIAAQLLRPLSELPCVHLLIGTRPRAVPALGSGFHRLDLDDPQWMQPGDIRAFAAQLLLAPDGPGSTSPYRQQTADPVARAIEARASGNYLVARLAARPVAQRPRTLDTTAPGWQDQLPELITEASRPAGPAFRWALRQQFEDQELRGRRLLTALALAEGTGLPAGAAWCAIATALTGDPVGPRDLDWILRMGGSHIVEDVDVHGRSVYRLYHETFADELRDDLTADLLRSVARALTGLVAPRPDGSGPDWAAADPYLREHLSTHAAAGGILDDLVTDPLFLAAAEPTALRRTLPGLRQPRARAVRDSYDRIAPHLAADTDVGARAALLRLTALEMGDRQLADATSVRVPDQPWTAEWAHVPSPPYPYRSLGRFPSGAAPQALVECDGRWVLLLGEERRITCWDTETCEPLGELPELADQKWWSSPYIEEVSTCPGGWALLKVSGGPLNRLQVWDVARRRPWGTKVGVNAKGVALVAYDDTLVAGAVDHDGHVRLFDMRTGHQLCHLTPRRRGPGLTLDSRLVMGAHDDTITVAAVHGGFGADDVVRVHRWTVAPRDAWRTLDGTSRRLRGRTLRDVLLHESDVVVATSDLRLASDRTRTDTVTDHGAGIEEWICVSGGQGAMDGGDFLLPTGNGLIRMTVHMNGVEAVDATGRRRTLLHADLPGMPRMAAVVTAPDEVLLATGEFLESGVSLWTVPLGGTRAADAEPHRFSVLFGTRLSQGRVAGQEVLALSDGAGLRCLDTATGRLVAREGKRRCRTAWGAPGQPLLVAGTHEGYPGLRPLRVLGRPRRHLVLRGVPPGDLRWLQPVIWQGCAAVLGVFGDRVAVWSEAGQRLCEVSLSAEPWAVACRVVADRLYVAFYAHDHGFRVIELPEGRTVCRLPEGEDERINVSLDHHRQPGAIALDEWDGKPVVGFVSLGRGIKIYDVLSGAEVWSSGEKDTHSSLYLHHMGDRRVAVTVDYRDTLRIVDIDGGSEVVRVPMGARIQSVIPLPDLRVAVLTTTGLYTLRFPGFSPDAAAPSCAESAPPPPDPPATDVSDSGRAAPHALRGSRPSRKRRGRR